MALDRGALFLRPEDLGDFELPQVLCRQCGCFCSERQPVFFEGRPVALCTRNLKGREVVKRWKAHASNA